MKKKLTLLLALCLLVAGTGCTQHQHSYTRSVIPPGCKNLGYTINTCSCGDTFYSDYQTQSAHQYGQWQPGQNAATLTEGGEEYRVCSVCGGMESRYTESTSILPKLFLDGEFPTEGGKRVSVSYSDGEALRFSCESDILPLSSDGKGAFAVSLLAEDAPYAVDLGYGEQSVYRLLPLSPDLTGVRSLFATTLWNSCTQDALWPVCMNVCAHPIQVYESGTYRGIYSLLLPQESWFASLSGSNTAALHTLSENDSSLFRKAPVYDPETGFSLLGCQTQDSVWAMESFSGFSDFVRRSSDATFKSQLAQYSDPSLLCDFFLLSYLFGLPREDTEHAVWYTTDGIHWLPCFYDLHCSFGLTHEGGLRDGGFGIPSPGEEGKVSYSGNNLLWERIASLFSAELRDRYRQLREGDWETETLLSSLQAQALHIEAELLSAEQTIDPTYSEKAASRSLLEAYLRKRLEKMDAWLGIDDKT